MTTNRTHLRNLLDFSARLRTYARNTVTVEEAWGTLIDQRLNRERNFLELLKTSVFENPRSPYLSLFEWAGLGYAEVERLVEDKGLDETLEVLYESGVYVTFEEFKCREPIRRGDREMTPRESDFDNLNLDSVISGSSGGSSGRATRSKIDLDHIGQCSKQATVSLAEHGVHDAPMFSWWGILPSAMGLMMGLRPVHFGRRVERWYATYNRNESGMGWKYALVTYLIVLLARFHGLKIPFPVSTPLDRADRVARELERAVRAHGKAFLVSTVSKCVRISVAAQKQAINLEGVVFLGSSEPVTPAKYDAIRASGARFISLYATTECGHIGLPCLNPADLTDMHLMSNNVALIQRPKDVLGRTVDAFHVTSLLPSNPKMMINVQSDDFGIVEERDCGCPFYENGFRTHVRQMSSYSKLTGEGVTLVGSDMERILEHDLPKKFGGSLLDYQLVEEETPEGFTKLLLYVSPDIPSVDEDAVLHEFHSAMRHSHGALRLADVEFESGNVVSVRRERPLLTAQGKHFPIRTLSLNS